MVGCDVDHAAAGCLQVHDSAASRGSWAEALGLLQEEPGSPPRQPSSLPSAAAGAGTNNPAGAAGQGSSCDVAVQVLLRLPHQQQGHAATQTDPTQQQQRGGSEAGQGVDSEQQLLLEAARQEVLRLQELNQQLMQAHARGEATHTCCQKQHARICV